MWWKLIRWKAVAAGFAAGFATMFSFVFFLGFVGQLINPNFSTWMVSTPALWLCIVVGAGLDVFSGLVTGRMAPGAELENAALLGILIVLETVCFSLSFPAWYITICSLTTIPAILFGAHIARKYSRPY